MQRYCLNSIRSKACINQYVIDMVQLLAKLDSVPDWRSIKTLGEYQSKQNLSLNEATSRVEKFLKDEPYAKTEICNLLGLTSDELKLECLSPNTLHVENFQLKKRSKHVFSEATRVYQFKVDQGTRMGCTNI